MKNTAILLLTVMTTVFAMAAETTNVTGIIKGKSVEFSSSDHAQLVQKSFDLLASCAHIDTKPNWGAPAEPQTIAGAQKQSHVRLVFSSPRNVEVSIVKATVKLREMVITLPLNTAGIWVRTDDGIVYFAKFKHTSAERLEKVLDEALEGAGR